MNTRIVALSRFAPRFLANGCAGRLGFDCVYKSLRKRDPSAPRPVNERPRPAGQIDLATVCILAQAFDRGFDLTQVGLPGEHALEDTRVDEDLSVVHREQFVVRQRLEIRIGERRQRLSRPDKPILDLPLNASVGIIACPVKVIEQHFFQQRAIHGSPPSPSYARAALAYALRSGARSA